MNGRRGPRLAFCLEHLADPDLLILARRLGLRAAGPLDGATRAELKAALWDRYRDERHLAEVLAALTPAERRLLRGLLLRLGGVFPRALVQRNPRLADGTADVARLVDRLAERGLVLRMNGEPVLPLDVAATMGRLLLAEAPLGPFVGDDEVTEPVEPIGPLAVADLVRILGALHRQPARITQQGVLYQKDRDRLEQVLHPLDVFDRARLWVEFRRPFREEPVPWRIPWSEYGNRLGSLLWFAVLNGLVAEDERRLAPVPDWTRRLAAHDRDRWWKALVDTIIEVYAAQAPLAFFFIEGLRHGGWLAPRRLVALYADADGMLGRDVEDVAAMVGLVVSLGRLGVVAAGRAAGEPVLRLTDEARRLIDGQPTGLAAETTFLVQPAGDVLAPPYLEPGVLAGLERLAVPVRVDNVTTYRLDRRAIARAIEEGMARHEVRAFLERHGRGPLPQPVAFAVEEWVARAGQLGFVEATLLACESAEVADAVARLSELEPHIVERISPTHFIVSGDALERLRTVLTRAGFPPRGRVVRMGGERPHPDPWRRREAPAADGSPTLGLFYSTGPYRELALER